ncbi:MAG: chromosomal replication initiator protein DnaA [Candidatus Margulisiibacteriota bacterium]
MKITKDSLIEELKNDLSEPNLQIFKNSIEVEDGPDAIKLIVNDAYMKQWIETKCLNIIRSYVNKITQIEVIEDLDTTDNNQLELFNVAQNPKPSKFNSLFTFDKFIVGNNNRFAFAAAEAVAKRPANAYNPLFLYGSVGIGKTHLLHAIANEISAMNLNVCLVTSEKFTNDLINSLRNRSTSEFKNRYRSIDVLLIDDIQFLAGKESTQEEFFHTFNELHGQNKQIVITSDCPPNDIPTLQDRLKTRFSWGLTADIQPPELETRIAILRTKLDQNNTDLSNEVLNYVATQFPNNVRELEGALNRITAYANLLDSKIDINAASKIIKDLINEQNKKPLTIPQIKRIVSGKLNISIDELASKSRTKEISIARQIAMYLCREVTNISLLKIGENFGNRDHSTVMHAIDKIKQKLLTENDVKTIVDELKIEIQKHCE